MKKVLASKTKPVLKNTKAPTGKRALTPQDNAVLGDQILQAGLMQLNPAFGDLCIRTSGEAYAKPLLSQKTKVLMALVVDIVEQIHGPPFANHLRMAVQQGVTQAEMEELLLFMTVYVGFNKAGTFYGPVKEFFATQKRK